MKLEILLFDFWVYELMKSNSLYIIYEKRTLRSHGSYITFLTYYMVRGFIPFLFSFIFSESLEKCLNLGVNYQRERDYYSKNLSMFWDAKILRTREINPLFKLKNPKLFILKLISWSPKFVLLSNFKNRSHWLIMCSIVE